MYADKITDSMAQAIDETNRRREKQVAYNLEQRHRPDAAAQEDRRHHRRARARGRRHRGAARRRAARSRAARRRSPGVGRGAARRHRPAAGWRPMPRADLADLIQELTDQMHRRPAELQFELAARLRDEIGDLKKELRQMSEATK